MVRRNIRPCSICPGVSATSTVKRCGPVALRIVSSELAKRWSWAPAANANKLAAIVAASSSNRVRRVIMLRSAVPDRGRRGHEHTPKGLAMTGESLHPATPAAQGLGWIDGSTGAVVYPAHTATTFLRDSDNQRRR